MGVRTRELDTKAGAAKPKSGRAARAEAEAVIQRWNDQYRGVATCCGRPRSAPRRSLERLGSTSSAHGAWSGLCRSNNALLAFRFRARLGVEPQQVEL
jgi:hypothetical protein